MKFPKSRLALSGDKRQTANQLAFLIASIISN